MLFPYPALREGSLDARNRATRAITSHIIFVHDVQGNRLYRAHGGNECEFLHLV